VTSVALSIDWSGCSADVEGEQVLHPVSVRLTE
jgi:hypothetical protein